jgi:hypothetical protein
VTELQPEHVQRGYLGSRYPDGRVYVGVIEDGAVAFPLPHVERHSPDGFEWGYEGSGPADLALSILAHVLGQPDPDKIPPGAYQQFKCDVVRRFGHTHWEIGRLAVLRWIDEHGDLLSEMF